MFCQRCGNKLKNSEGTCTHCGNADQAVLENSYRQEDLIARLFREDPAFSLIWGNQTPQPLPELQPQPAPYTAAPRVAPTPDSLTAPGRFQAQEAAPVSSAPSVTAKKQPRTWGYLAAGAAGMLALGIVLQLGISAFRGKSEEPVKTGSAQTTVAESTPEAALSPTEVLTEPATGLPTEPDLVQPGETLSSGELEQYNRCDKVEDLIEDKKWQNFDNYGTQLFEMLNLIKGQPESEGSVTENPNINWDFQSSKVTWEDSLHGDSYELNHGENDAYEGTSMYGNLYFQRTWKADGTSVLLGLRGIEGAVPIQENSDDSYQWGNLNLAYGGDNQKTIGKQYHIEWNETRTTDASNPDAIPQQETVVTTDDLYVEGNFAALREQSGNADASYSFYWISEGYAYPIDYVFRMVAVPEETTEASSSWDESDTGTVTTTEAEFDMEASGEYQNENDGEVDNGDEYTPEDGDGTASGDAVSEENDGYFSPKTVG